MATRPSKLIVMVSPALRSRSSPNLLGEGDQGKSDGGVVGAGLCDTPPPPFGWSPSPCCARGGFSAAAHDRRSRSGQSLARPAALIGLGAAIGDRAGAGRERASRGGSRGSHR